MRLHLSARWHLVRVRVRVRARARVSGQWSVVRVRVSCAAWSLAWTLARRLTTPS